MLRPLPRWPSTPRPDRQGAATRCPLERVNSTARPRAARRAHPRGRHRTGRPATARLHRRHLAQPPYRPAGHEIIDDRRPLTSVRIYSFRRRPARSRRGVARRGEEPLGYVFSGGPGAARPILSAVATSLVSLTTLPLSLTIVTPSWPAVSTQRGCR